MEEVGLHYLKVVNFQYKKLKLDAERALEQVSDDQFHHFIDEESNSIALLVKHISGNMRSRWTDFLTSDGEKADRNRPSEFDQSDKLSRDYFMKRWENSWEILFGLFEELKEVNLMQKIKIRDEEHTVVEAIQRQLTHYAAHIGQITFLAKHLNFQTWDSLSIPRNKTQFTNGSYKSN